MADRTSSSTSPLNWALYFLAGGVAGAAAALLLAPQSGTATRERMRRRLRHTADSSRDLKDHWIRRSQRARSEARHRMEDAVSALAGDEKASLPV
jgi:gas vesicle protein